MGSPITSGQNPVPVLRHTFWLTERAAVCGPRIPLDRSNGLIDPQPGVAVIFTGIARGSVAVSVAVHGESPEVDTTGWDEVVEATVESPSGDFVVTGIEGDAPAGLPVLTANGPGSYRVRVHARGRDISADLDEPEPVEDYLIAVWPDTSGPVTIHKQTDVYGALLRQAA